MHQITIEWEGPLTLHEVIAKCNDAGKRPRYDGEDYGIYQIYGRYILDDPKAPFYKKSLLYIGEATEQTFSSRFREHKRWLEHEWKKSITIHVGRLAKHYDTNRKWKADVLLAERIMIYTYSPHYNSNSISSHPSLSGHKKVVVVHKGDPGRGRLRRRDVVPKDWE